MIMEGQHCTMVCCFEFNSQHSQKNFSEKMSMLLRLIKGAAWRKVDSGLKMLIKPI